MFKHVGKQVVWQATRRWCTSATQCWPRSRILICLVCVNPAIIPSSGSLAADPALLVAAVGLADHLAAALVDLHPAGLHRVRCAQRAVRFWVHM